MGRKARVGAALILRYARRMLIENGLADAVNFLHLDALSSAVALNVSFDVLLTTLATGIYRPLARQLRGFERAQPRQLWRRVGRRAHPRPLVGGTHATVRNPLRTSIEALALLVA